jgi:DNA-directed RNA polymerase subunit RPC12/RpoP
MFGGLQNGSLSGEKKRGRKPGGPIAHDAINHTSERNGDNSHGDMGGPGGTKKPRKSGGAKKASAKVEGEENGATAAGGNKRSYSCPHCQRSYDWNYNLNRHLKYECGKENAFQCAKCGRKFPHKQNCVYHLKRKHKIVCETIDQYVAAGLVVFNGSSNPGGQGSGKGDDEGGMMNNSGLLPASMSQGHTQLQPITTTMTSTRVA